MCLPAAVCLRAPKCPGAQRLQDTPQRSSTSIVSLQGHVYLCDDAPKTALAPNGATYRNERTAMMGLEGDASPTSLRVLTRGDANSPLFRKARFL